MSERGGTEFDDVVARLAGGAKPTATDIQALSDLDAGQLNSLRRSWGRISEETRSTIVADAIAVSDDSVHFEFSRLGHVAMEDDTPAVRLMGVEILRETLDWGSARKLVAAVSSDPDEAVAAAAGEVLGSYVLGAELDRIDSERARGIVTTLRTVAADHGQPVNVRAAAVESLGASSLEWVEGVILDALYEDDAVLRLAAVRAMGASGNERWVEYLIDQAGSDEAEFREEAAVAFGELALEDAIEPLTLLLEDESPDVIDASIRALGQIGGELAIETLKMFAEMVEEPAGPLIAEAIEAASVAMFEIDREETDW